MNVDRMFWGIIFLWAFFLLNPLGAQEESAPQSPELSKDAKVKVRYRKSGRIDFESLLIEGERKRPEMSVVTGNVGEKDSGLLKFRKDFLDMISNDLGEAIP